MDGELLELHQKRHLIITDFSCLQRKLQFWLKENYNFLQWRIIFYQYIVDRGVDTRTSGLWAQASAAPIC